MHTAFPLLLQLLLIAIVGHCSEEPKTPITCDAGTYYVGESASVTCNFNLDMSKEGHAIIVEWYPKNATTKIIGKEVFECKKKEPNQTRHCDPKVNEYTFNGVINDRLKLDIPSVSENIAGMYTCFILPATGTDPHVCTLTVQAGTRPTDKKDETDESNTLWLVVLLIIPAVGVVLVLTVLRFRRKRNLMYRKQNVQMDPLVMQPLIPGVGWQTALPANLPKKMIEELVKDFKLSTADCQRVMELLSQAMDADSADDTHPSVKMRPVYIRCLPEDIRDAAFLVVDFGSANLKIHLVKIQNKGHESGVRSEHYTIPTSIRLGTDTQLFEFIGDCIKKFVELHNLSDKRYRVGFVFSFPCEHKNDLTKARLIKWTKEFNCRGVEDRDPGELLQKVLVEISKPDQLDVKTIVNDAMGSLIYGDRDATRCKMAVTLANGFHACCMQATPSSEEENVNMVIMKTELGALGGNKSMYTSNTKSDTDDCLKLFRTEYDIALDKYSINRGEQILEKMVSIMYLGEIVRLVLVKLTEKRLLFKSADHKSSDLHKRDCLNADHVSLIERYGIF
ncbi:hypothetical protein V1264_017456 [Littorina saxatilis]|uniref:Phosphotransferase n=1 Tax=Littorina saxatilis TaxID=31220 RepID=A0AAN9BJ82_9CAEN